MTQVARKSLKYDVAECVAKFADTLSDISLRMTARDRRREWMRASIVVRDAARKLDIENGRRVRAEREREQQHGSRV